MRNDFRIGLGGELVAFFDQLLLQAEIVLDNPVMHDHDLARAVAVGMSIFFGRTSVCGPARVPNAIRAVERLLANDFFQVAQLALGAPQLQSVAVTGYRDSSRIIAAILQPPQPFDDDRNYTFLADVPNNATHGKTSKDSQPSLLGQGETEFFNDGIGQHLAGDPLDLGLRLFAR